MYYGENFGAKPYVIPEFSAATPACQQAGNGRKNVWNPESDYKSI